MRKHKLYDLGALFPYLLVLGGMLLTGSSTYSFNKTVELQVSQNADGLEVKGIVRDSVGVVPNVTITVKNNAKIGTTTDQNGRFIIEVPDKNTILVFQMVGYVTQEVVVANNTDIDLLIETSNDNLEEVVVVAFGKQKKEDVIGAVTSVNPSNLKIPSSNLTTALAGQVAGMIAYQRSGEPGADNADFFIRGVTTFGYKKDPLILIDGIEVTSRELAWLQPDK